MIPVSKPSITDSDRDAVEDALRREDVAAGPDVARFEDALLASFDTPAAYYDIYRRAVACSSGTTALHLALAALGIGPGDEVIVPASTYVATANAVRYTGATVVLVDVRPSDWTLDPLLVAHAITDRTAAIIAVDLYGQLADYQALSRFYSARSTGPDGVRPIPVIADAAQALGARSKYNQPAGTFATLTTFSFYGNKIITTGHGGAVVTADTSLVDRLRTLRGQGIRPGGGRYDHTELGFNYNLANMNAALGRAQLRRLPLLLSRRHAIFNHYDDVLGWRRPFSRTEAPWLWTALVPDGVNRDLLAAYLSEEDIETRPAFPCLASFPMYRTAQRFPVAEMIAAKGLSLPTYPDIDGEDLERVTTTVLGAV